MYSTPVYFYIPRHTVVMYTGASNRRYEIVYAKNITLNKGVVNQIQFEFLNQDQKPIDVTGTNISFRLISNDGSTVHLTKQVDSTYSAGQVLPIKGITQLTVLATELEGIDPQNCSYSLSINNNGELYPIFVNADAAARGVAKVVDSVLPSFTPSRPVSIPSHPPLVNLGPTITYYSSVVEGSTNPTTTIQFVATDFVGTAIVQGNTSAGADTEWYDIDTHEYTGVSMTSGYSVNGLHPFIRLKFTNVSNGEVSNLYLR